MNGNNTGELSDSNDEYYNSEYESSISSDDSFDSSISSLEDNRPNFQNDRVSYLRADSYSLSSSSSSDSLSTIDSLGSVDSSSDSIISSNNFLNDIPQTLMRYQGNISPTNNTQPEQSNISLSNNMVPILEIPDFVDDMILTSEN